MDPAAFAPGLAALNGTALPFESDELTELAPLTGPQLSPVSQAVKNGDPETTKELVVSVMLEVNASMNIDFGAIDIADVVRLESPEDPIEDLANTSNAADVSGLPVTAKRSRDGAKAEFTHAHLVCEACGYIVVAVAKAVIQAVLDSQAEGRLSGDARPIAPPKKKRGGILGFKELAAKAKLSPWHFHRVFRSVTNVTPKAYGEASWEHLMRRYGFEVEAGSPPKLPASPDGINRISPGSLSESSPLTRGVNLPPVGFTSGQPSLISPSPSEGSSTASLDPKTPLSTPVTTAGRAAIPGRVSKGQARNRSRSRARSRSRSRHHSQTQHQVLNTLSQMGRTRDSSLERMNPMGMTPITGTPNGMNGVGTVNGMSELMGSPSNGLAAASISGGVPPLQGSIPYSYGVKSEDPYSENGLDDTTELDARNLALYDDITDHPSTLASPAVPGGVPPGLQPRSLAAASMGQNPHQNLSMAGSSVNYITGSNELSNPVVDSNVLVGSYDSALKPHLAQHHRTLSYHKNLNYAREPSSLYTVPGSPKVEMPDLNNLTLQKLPSAVSSTVDDWIVGQPDDLMADPSQDLTLSASVGDFDGLNGDLNGESLGAGLEASGLDMGDLGLPVEDPISGATMDALSNFPQTFYMTSEQKDNYETELLEQHQAEDSGHINFADGLDQPPLVLAQDHYRVVEGDITSQPSRNF